MKSIVECIRKIVWFFRMLILICKHGEEKLLKDPLTKSLSRFCLEEFGEREIKRAERHESSLCGIMFDLDGLKQINDGEGGHDAGDRALRVISNIFQKICRATDILLRMGGDEFFMLLPEISELGVEQLLERVKKEIKKEKLSISASSYFWKKNMTLEELVKGADADLYRNKNSKKKKPEKI